MPNKVNWKVIWAVIAGSVIVLTLVALGFNWGSAARPDEVPQQVADDRSKAPPIARKLRDAFLVPIAIDYHYPEEQDKKDQAEYEELWNNVFFGRQPPMFLSLATGKPKLITPPRAVHDPEHGRVSEGDLIFAVRYEPKSRQFELEGRGYYTDWLDTGEEDPGAPNPQDSRYIPFKWGVRVSFVKRPFSGDLRDGSPVDLDFMLSGAGAKTHFMGRATLSADDWIKEQDIELFFVRSDRFTGAQNDRIREDLKKKKVSLATVRIGLRDSNIRPLGSDEWWQGFDITPEP